MTADQARQAIFEKYQNLNQRETAGKVPTDYLLKVTGFRSFLTGSNKLIDYDYIRLLHACTCTYLR